ncbi:hypothetical protein BSPA111_14740 [Buttiauxella sp. A111]|nr:hypothetical protein BSPA111_14740 [Buttiauxella sp. A111]
MGVHGVITRHGVDGQGVMRLGIEHDGFVFHRNRGVTGIIDTRHHHLHVVTAFEQGVGRYRHLIAQVPVFIDGHRAVERLAVNADHHVIADLRITGDLAADQSWHTGFGSVDHVVSRHGINGQGIVRLGVEHHGFMFHRNCRITGIINAGDHHLHVVTAFGQRVGWHRHFIAQMAVFIDGHRAVERLAVNADYHVIAHLRVTRDLAANQSWHAGFSSVDHVVSRHGVDGQGVVRLGIERDGFVLNGNGFVTRRIVADELDLYVISPFFEKVGWNRHFVVQLAVIVHDNTVEIAATYRHGNRVAFMSIATDHTRYHGWHAGFGSVNDVIACHGLD